MRFNDRPNDQPRLLSCKPSINRYAWGSCIFEMGHTKVHCTAAVTDKLPRWRKESGEGWVTAEYRMLPHSTHTRGRREGDALKGRTSEIQRLIGRSLRAAVDMKALGGWQITIDCDVLQADGGTRTASINGGYIAMVLAMKHMVSEGHLDKLPLINSIAAVSVGIVDGKPMSDLCYEEDFAAAVDLNLVMTGDGRLVEVQGTAEEEPFSISELNELIKIGLPAIEMVSTLQTEVLGR